MSVTPNNERGNTRGDRSSLEVTLKGTPRQPKTTDGCVQKRGWNSLRNYTKKNSGRETTQHADVKHPSDLNHVRSPNLLAGKENTGPKGGKSYVVAN